MENHRHRALLFAAGTVTFYQRAAIVLKTCNYHVRNSGNSYSQKKGEMSLYGESQFNSQLLQLGNP
jgi:hypothetical protein